ncbi:MAG: DUF4332 domain-containing protein [Anaerolineae bacterium]
MTRIAEIEGIGKTYAAKLREAGISSVEALLEQAGPADGRKALAEKTGISPALILEWVNHADLFRINGIGEEYSDLLEEAGVDTVVELAQRNPHSLHAKLAEVNRAKKLVRQLPSQAQVSDWVAQAKSLPRAVSY